MAKMYILELKEAPVEKNECIDAETLMNDEADTLFRFADYVEDITEEERAEAFNELKERPGIWLNQEVEKLMIASKYLYFRSAFARFQNALSAAKAMDEEEFMSRKSSQAMWNIKEAYCDSYDFYVYHDRILQPLDRFVRENPEGTARYIGGVVRYHF